MTQADEPVADPEQRAASTRSGVHFGGRYRAGPIAVLHVDAQPDVTGLTATFLERTDEDIDVVPETMAGDALDRLVESADEDGRATGTGCPTDAAGSTGGFVLDAR